MERIIKCHRCGKEIFTLDGGLCRYCDDYLEILTILDNIYNLLKKETLK